MSETIKSEEFEDLYSFLRKNEKIRHEDIKKVPQLKNLNAYIDELLKECQLEWVPDRSQPVKDLGENYHLLSRCCELCGKRPIRYENTIVNQVNLKRIVVGTECVKEFSDETQLRIQNSRKAAKRLYLEKKIPGLRLYIEYGREYPRSLDMIIPLELEEKWLELHLEISQDYQHFLDEKITRDSAIQKKWKTKLHLEEELNRYVDVNKHKKHASNQEIYQWLKKNNNHDVIKMIQEDNGFIQWRTIHRIYERNLMRKTIMDLDEKVARFNIRILSLIKNSNKVLVEFYGKYNRRLRGTINYKNLLLELGGLLFAQPIDDSDVEIVIKESKITEDCQGRLLMFITKKIKGLELIDDYHIEGEVAYKQSRKYYVVNRDSLINQLKIPYLKDLEMNYMDIFSTNTIKELTQDEFREHIEFKRDIEREFRT